MAATPRRKSKAGAIALCQVGNGGGRAGETSEGGIRVPEPCVTGEAKGGRRGGDLWRSPGLDAAASLRASTPPPPSGPPRRRLRASNRRLPPGLHAAASLRASNRRHPPGLPAAASLRALTPPPPSEAPGLHDAASGPRRRRLPPGLHAASLRASDRRHPPSDNSGLRRLQFGIAKKIKNGARKIVLEKAEAARVAAFSAFKSLGVQVPQFTTPLLPATEESPTRDIMVSPGRDDAKCHEPALGTRAGVDRNIYSDYVAQRAFTESLGEDMNPVSSAQIKETAGIANDVNTVTVQEASPLSAKSIDQLCSRNVANKGPVNAYNFPGGFDSFLDQWSSVSEFSFDLHFVKRSIKLSLTLFEVLGLAVRWENSPIYYCNFPKDLITTGKNDSIEMWGEFNRRWNRIVEIMQQKSVKKMTWNLKIQIQALKSSCFSCQRLARLHIDHKMLNNVEVLDNTYVLLPPIFVYNGLDICLVAWVLWPDEESKTVPNLEKLVKRRLHSEAAAAANQDGRWRNQMHKAAHNGCCRRAAQTRALGSVLWKLLVSQNLNDLIETIEGPLVNVLADMELWGIGADMDACLRARNIIIKKLKELERQAYKLAGKSFSLNATADIADILYTHLKLLVPNGCDKGKLHPSTDKQSLDHLRVSNCSLQFEQMQNCPC